MKKGFTLIELLGVIIILALLALIVFPSVINFIKKGNDAIDNNTLKLIYNAADMYIRDNNKYFPKNNGNNYCISFQELIDSSNLKTNMLLNYSDISNTKKIQVTYDDNKYNFKLVEKETCKDDYRICRIINESKLGIDFNANIGLQIGNELKCNVNSDIDEYTFYVLSENKNDNNEIDSYNLIMNMNIVPTSPWISQEDYIKAGGEGNVNTTKGPITVLNELYSATSNWYNLDSINENFTDESKHYETIYLDGNSRLPTKTELTSPEVGCGYDYGTCPKWVVENLSYYEYYEMNKGIVSPKGYWTLTTNNANSGIAYYISNRGCELSYGGAYYDAVSNAIDFYGARPVIKVYLDKINLYE